MIDNQRNITFTDPSGKQQTFTPTPVNYRPTAKMTDARRREIVNKFERIKQETAKAASR